MKSSVFTRFSALCLVFGALNVTGQYSVTMPYKTVTVENVKGTASFSGAFPNENVGQPALPAYRISFLLPPDADFSGVSVSLDGVAEDTLSETYTVNPVSAPSPEYVARKGLRLVDGKDMAVYGKNEFFPADYKGKISFGLKRQYKIVDVVIYPYLYNPKTNKLRTITGGTLTVTVLKHSNQVINMPRSERTERSLKGAIANPSVFENYGAKPQSLNQSQGISSQITDTSFGVASQMSTAAIASLYLTGRVYMIVTTNYIKNNSTKLNSYISSLQARGATVYTATEDQLGYSTGQAKTDVIRSYLAVSLENQGLTDVVLIGNSDPNTGEIPMYKYLDGNDTVGTDYYYADIWDTLFPDNYAELNVGRIPYIPTQYNPIAVLDSLFVRDTVYALQTGNNAKWRRFAMLPCVPYGFSNPASSNADNFSEYGEALKDSLWKAGWEYYRLYEPYNWSFSRDYKGCLEYAIVNMRVHPEEYFCNYSNVIAAWNKLNPGLVVWATHGGKQVADRILDGIGQQNDNIPQQAYLLNNSYPAMVYASSCGTAYPFGISGDTSGCLAAQTVRYNAISYIGATADANNDPDIANGYVAAIKDTNNYTCAEALNMAKQRASWFDNLCLFNLYGFPDACLNLDKLGSLHPPKLDSVRVGQTNPKSKIKIIWDTVWSATSYIVERGDSNATRISGFSYLTTITGGVKNNYVDSNPALPSSTKFKYRIYAQNASGSSGYSRIDSARTYDAGNNSLYAPAPTGITAQGDRSNGARVSWPTAGSGVSYVVKRSRFSTGPFDPISITSNLFFMDTNLVNDTTYYYVVSSVNSSGQSPHSPVSSATIPHLHINPPNLTLVQCNTTPGLPANSLSINWAPTNVNGFYPLGYQLSYIELFPENTLDTINRSFQSSGIFTRFCQFDAIPTYSLYSWCAGGISGNSKYCFRMQSTSQNATLPYIFSNASSAYPYTTLNSNYPPPDKLTMQGGSQITNEYAQIWWLWGPPHTEGIQVFCKDITGGQTGRPWRLADDADGDRSDDVIQIGANRKCKFYVRQFKTYNGVRVYSDYSDSIVVTTDALLCSPAISINSFTDRKAVINIQDNSLSDTGYSIERKTGSSGTFSVVGTIKEPNVSPYTDSGSLVSGQKYYYRVRAYAGSVYSAYSNIDSVTLRMPAYMTMGFESADHWRFIGGSGTLSDNYWPTTQGSASMQVSGNGWQQIKSINLKTTDINATSNQIKFDLFIGSTQPDTTWIGQVQFYVNCPSVYISNFYIGQANLAGKPLDAFSTFTFTLPPIVMAALAGNHNDFSFSIVLNTRAGSGPYYFDNMRF